MSTKDPQLILADAPFVSQFVCQYLDLSTCSLYNLQNHLITEAMLAEDVTETIEVNINKIVGHCNGLVCLLCHDYRHVVFWNPSTRISRTLPKINTVPDYVCPEYGFGYDDCNDDFKVFAIYGGKLEYEEVSVYSSKSDSWRVIHTGDLHCGQVSGAGVFANRAIYWQLYEADDYFICFDIKTETCRQVLQPIDDLDEIPYWSLGHFGNSLYVLNILDTRVDIWVIKEFDPEESWTKLVTIEYDRLTPYDGLLSRIKPICTLENGVILLNLHTYLVLHNTNDKTVVEDPLDWYYERIHVYCYVESLVSP